MGGPEGKANWAAFGCSTSVLRPLGVLGFRKALFLAMACAHALQWRRQYTVIVQICITIICFLYLTIGTSWLLVDASNKHANFSSRQQPPTKLHQNPSAPSLGAAATPQRINSNKRKGGAPLSDRQSWCFQAVHILCIHIYIHIYLYLYTVILHDRLCRYHLDAGSCQRSQLVSYSELYILKSSIVGGPKPH